MSPVSDPDVQAAAGPEPGLLRPLLPGGGPASATELVQASGLWERADAAPPRPRVLLNMVSSADGLATRSGRSGGLSSPADRRLFHALRAAADAILVGAGTVRTERYGPVIRDEAVRAQRVQRGLAEEPLACIVSAGLAIPVDIPLLADPRARVVIVTPSEGEIGPCAAHVDYVRCEEGGLLDLTAALRELASRFGVRLLLCEGGPHLGHSLLAAGLLDELYLSLAPQLLGSGGTGGELRILAGEQLEPPVALDLLSAQESESHLFLRYGVLAPERVSRETIESSSLAR